MNRTIKDATVKRYLYETHDQRARICRDSVDAYNFARSPNDSNSIRSTKRWD